MAACIMVFHERKWDRYRRQRREEGFITKCRRVFSIIETGGVYLRKDKRDRQKGRFGTWRVWLSSYVCAWGATRGGRYDLRDGWEQCRHCIPFAKQEMFRGLYVCSGPWIMTGKTRNWSRVVVRV